MLSLTHAVTGAALGGQLSSPFFAFLGGVILHLILDRIPHFWPKMKKQQDTIILVDGILVAIFIIGIYLWGGENRNLMIAGALGGAMVDATLVLTFLKDKRIGLWHTNRQPHKTNFWYYLSDFLLIVTGSYLIWFLV